MKELTEWESETLRRLVRHSLAVARSNAGEITPNRSEYLDEAYKLQKLLDKLTPASNV